MVCFIENKLRILGKCDQKALLKLNYEAFFSDSALLNRGATFCQAWNNTD